MRELRVILEQLEDQQLDYVFERSRTTSNAKALKAAGIPESTFYSWDDAEREKLNEYAQELKRNRLLKAELVLIEAAEEAARVMVDHAAASMEDFITVGDDGQPYLDLTKAGGKLHLIKKLNYDKDGELRSMELHDSQSAARDVLDRTTGKPSQKVDITSAGEKVEAPQIFLPVPGAYEKDEDDV